MTKYNNNYISNGYDFFDRGRSDIAYCAKTDDCGNIRGITYDKCGFDDSGLEDAYRAYRQCVDNKVKISSNVNSITYANPIDDLEYRLKKVEKYLNVGDRVRSSKSEVASRLKRSDLILKFDF